MHCTGKLENRLLLPETRLGAAKERTKGYTISLPRAPSKGFPLIKCSGKENGNCVKWKASQEDQNPIWKQSCIRKELPVRGGVHWKKGISSSPWNPFHGGPAPPPPAAGVPSQGSRCPGAALVLCVSSVTPGLVVHVLQQLAALVCLWFFLWQSISKKLKLLSTAV